MGQHGADATNGDVIRILPATTYTHKSLRASQEWEYQVYAFNRYGHSEETSGTRDVTTQDAREPTAPAGLKLIQGVTDNGGPEINVYWNAPDDGGQDVTGYRVEVTDKSSSWPETLTNAEALTNFDVMTGTTATDKDAVVPLLADTVDADANVAVFTLAVDTQTRTLNPTSCSTPSPRIRRGCDDLARGYAVLPGSDDHQQCRGRQRDDEPVLR